MKKIFYVLMMCAGAVLVSCEKEEPGATSTVSMAGDWYVTYDAVNENNEVIYDDIYGVGQTMLYTYNTNANDGKEMYIDDQKNFWEYKVKTPVNLATLTFGSKTEVGSEGSDLKVLVEDGKIMYGAATTPHGTPADSIVFYVTFSDDDYVGQYYSRLRVSGYRYTGLAEDM